MVLFFSSCNNSKDEWYPIPENSSLVIRVNGSSISKKIASDKLLDFEFSDLFNFSKDTVKQQSELSQLIHSPYKSGIAIFENFYLFKKNNLIGIYASLHNHSDLSEYIEEVLKKNPDKIQNHRFVYLDNALIAWDNQKCLLLFKEDSTSVTPQELEEVLQLKKDQTIFKNEKFNKNNASPSDIAFWFSAKELLKQYSSLIVIENIFNKDYSSANINFEEGKITIQARDVLDPKVSSILREPTKSNNKGLFSPTGILNLDVAKLIELAPKDSVEKTLHHLQLSQSDLLETFTGEILFNISGINETEKKYTTYTYDDDFNKIEIVGTKKVYYPEFSLLIKSADITIAEKTLKTLSEKNLIEKKDNHHYESIYTGAPVFIDNSPEGIYLSSQKEESLTIHSPADSIKNHFQNPFYISINPKNFSGLFTKEGFNKKLANSLESIWLTVSKENNNELVIHSEIIFSEVNQNSLSSIIEVVKNRP